MKLTKTNTGNSCDEITGYRGRPTHKSSDANCHFGGLCDEFGYFFRNNKKSSFRGKKIQVNITYE